MRNETHASPDDIDIMSLWSVLRRSGLKIVAASVLIGGLTLGGLTLVPSRYSSEVQLRIGGQDINDPFRSPKVGQTPNSEAVAVKVDKEAVASQVVALKSRDLAAKLTQELRLVERPEFNARLPAQGMGGKIMRMLGVTAPPAGESDEDGVLRAYYKSLQVFQVKDTRVITIEFSSQDNELAAKAANRLAELYQDWLRSQGVTQTAGAGDWLQPQIEKLAREVSTAESEVERFRSQANLFRSGGLSGGNLNEQQLSDLSAEVSKARGARSEAEARARAARELLQRNNPEAIPELQKSPIIQALIQQRVRAEREKAEAETSLLPGHPRMKQLNANVADLRRAINKEAVALVEGLEKEAKTFAIREELAVKNLDDMKSRVGNKSNDIAKLASLEGAAKAKRRELETLQERFEAARTRSDVKAVPLDAAIISTAHPSTVPTSPKRVQLASLAAAASLILGFALVITRELISGARRGGSQPPMAPERIQARAPAPAAAPSPAPVAAAVAGPAARKSAPAPHRMESEVAISTAPAGKSKTADEPVFAADPHPASGSPPTPVTAIVPPARADVPMFASREPAARQASRPSTAGEVAERLLANGGNQGGYRTVVVLDGADGDARDEAADLASVLAAAGKQIALLDWSLDGHGLAADLGMEPSPGFVDLMEGRASFEDVIRRLPDGDAHVIPCGGPRETAGDLPADRLNLILDALDEAYDHLIVTGRQSDVRNLFLAIEGRFDAAVVVGDGRSETSGDDTFLGFQVTDIDVIHFGRSDAAAPAAAPSSTAGPRMQLARRPEAEAHM